MMTCILGDEMAYSSQIANVEIDCFAQVTNVNGTIHDCAIKCYTQILTEVDGLIDAPASSSLISDTELKTLWLETTKNSVLS